MLPRETDSLLVQAEITYSFTSQPLRATDFTLLPGGWQRNVRGPQGSQALTGPERCLISQVEGGQLNPPLHRETLMPKKLFVGNLPHEVTDTQLQEFISAAGFQAVSAIVIRDKMTGQSRGFGFIELADGEDLERVIAGLNGQSLQGRRLTVNEARPPRNDFGGRPHSGGGGGGGRHRGGGGRPGGGRRRDESY